MSDPALQGFAGGPPGASGPAGEEPFWVIVAWQVYHYPFARGEHALVDTDDPEIQRLLALGWIIPLDEPDAIERGE